jgi:release factor glutamine methyltransferase
VSPATDAATTLAALVEELAAVLAPSLGGPAHSETRRLVQLATGADRTRLLLHPDAPVAPEAAARARALAARRAAGEPFAYLTGEREFRGLTFATGPGVLVPRPESETMIDAALAHVAPERPARVLDLGTGSGCLLLALVHERPRAFGLGVERSAAALAYAARNRRALGLEARCALILGSWLDAVTGRFDLVLANPPYIPAGEIDALMADVRDFEPRLALDGGDDGLAPHRLILAGLAPRLAPGGLALLEIGHEQGAAALAAARLAGFADARLLRDLGDRDRCLAVAAPAG